jgi:hypothetical protein
MRIGIHHAAETCRTVIYLALPGVPVLFALLMSTAKPPDRIRPGAPVAKRRFSVTLGAVLRKGNTRSRSNNETEF